MTTLDYKEFYRRKLPHFQSTGSTLFLTSRLAGSLPASVLRRWQLENQASKKANKSMSLEDQRRRFVEYDSMLHQVVCGPTWLSDPAQAIAYRDGRVFHLHAYCVMPNHVHMVFAPMPNEELREDYAVASIMHSLKSYTANQANSHLGRSGQFWQHENFDRTIRDDALWARTIAYVLNNPVKAGLVGHWRDWPYSYCRF